MSKCEIDFSLKENQKMVYGRCLRVLGKIHNRMFYWEKALGNDGYLTYLIEGMNI